MSTWPAYTEGNPSSYEHHPPLRAYDSALALSFPLQLEFA